MQIIIVAGGGGTRLWPVSNQKVPKQFARVVGHKSSLEHVYEYLSQAFGNENLWINTNQKFAKNVLELIPEFDPNRILLEPQKRDNFAAVAAQAAKLSHFFGDKEALIFVTSDEFMLYSSSIKKFQNAVAMIAKSLESDEFDVLTMGIKASSANVNYGYLELRESDKYISYEKPVPVVRFYEKPDYDTAVKFLEMGNYIWNKFNPAFKFVTLKKFLQQNDPETLKILLKIEKTGIIEESEYQKLPKTPFDYKFMEKVQNIGVVGLDITDWVDVGNWEIAGSYLPQIEPGSNQIEVCGENNKAVVSSTNKKIAFVGVDDLLLVETEDAILVLNPKHSSDVKKVAEYFENKDS